MLKSIWERLLWSIEFNQVQMIDFCFNEKGTCNTCYCIRWIWCYEWNCYFEDIVEEIVGEIDDEYDDTSDDIVKINDHEYLVDGSLNLNEVNDEIDTHFESEDFESIGGLVLGEFSGVPKIKDKIEFPGVTIIIEKMT